MARWNVSAFNAAGSRRELTTATARRLRFNLDAAHSFAFALNGNSDDAKHLTQFVSDVCIVRDGVDIFYGRLLRPRRTLDGTSHRAAYQAISYRGWLDRRTIGAAGRTFTNVDQATIAKTLIDESQALPGGNLSITTTVSTHGQNRTVTFDAGAPLGQTIARLGRESDTGFEWEIDATLALKLYSPRAGVDRSIVLDYGGKVTALSQTGAGDYANAVVGTAGGSAGASSLAALDVATDPRGRMEVGRSFTDVETIGELDAAIARTLDELNEERAEYVVTLRRGTWPGPSELWLGDTFELRVDAGSLSEKVRQRIVSVEIDLPTDGGPELVTLGTQAAPEVSP